MPIRLDAQAADFAPRFRVFLDTKRETAQDVEQAVRGIIDEVRQNGDRALIALTQKFDRVDLTKTGLRVPQAEIDGPAAQCAPATLDALKLARERIEVYHRRQLPKDERTTDALGVELGSRWTAMRRSAFTCRAAPRLIRLPC
jgi:Histidinol dehydrogenase